MFPVSAARELPLESPRKPVADTGARFAEGTEGSSAPPRKRKRDSPDGSAAAQVARSPVTVEEALETPVILHAIFEQLDDPLDWMRLAQVRKQTQALTGHVASARYAGHVLSVRYAEYAAVKSVNTYGRGGLTARSRITARPAESKTAVRQPSSVFPFPVPDALHDQWLRADLEGSEALVTPLTAKILRARPDHLEHDLLEIERESERMRARTPSAENDAGGTARLRDIDERRAQHALCASAIPVSAYARVLACVNFTGREMEPVRARELAYRAARLGDAEALSYFLDPARIGNEINIHSVAGDDHLLHRAVLSGDRETLARVLELPGIHLDVVNGELVHPHAADADADDADEEPPDDEDFAEKTAFHLAADAGNMDFLRMLFTANEHTFEMQNPATYVAEYAPPDCLSKLLDFPVEFADDDLSHAFVALSNRNEAPAFAAALKHPKVAERYEFEFDATAFASIVQNGNFRDAREILRTYPVDVNAHCATEFDETLLMQVARYEHKHRKAPFFPVLAYLLKQPDVDLALTSTAEENVLFSAVRSGDPEKVALVLNHCSALARAFDFGHVNSDDENILHVAADAADRKTVDSIGQLLLEHAAVRTLINEREDAGDTVLHYAARGGHAGFLYRLLSYRHADPNILNEIEYTPLASALNAYVSEDDAVRRAEISACVGLLLEDPRRLTPADAKARLEDLGFAAKCGHAGAVRRLLPAVNRADLTKAAPDFTPFERAWRTVHLRNDALPEAVDAVNAFLEYAAVDPNIFTVNGLHPFAKIHQSTHLPRKTFSKLFDVLISNERLNVNHRFRSAENDADQLSLYERIGICHPLTPTGREVLQKLLARPDLNVNGTRPDGLRPIDIAVAADDDGLIREILAHPKFCFLGPPVSSRGQAAWVNFHDTAVGPQAADTLRQFWTSRFGDVNDRIYGGHTLAQFSARAHTAEGVAKTFADPLIDVTSAHFDGLSPIFWAVLQRDPSIVTAMLNAGGDRMHTQPECFLRRPAMTGNPADVHALQNESVLHAAVRRNEPGILKALLDSPYLPPQVPPHTHQGKTALHQAVLEKKHELIDVMLASGKFDLTLRTIGAGGTIEAGGGKGLLHLAAESGDADMLRRLAGMLPKNMLSSYDADENTPLHLALENGHDAAALELFRCGADAFESLNRSGLTAFEVAAERRKSALAQAFLRAVPLTTLTLPRTPYSVLHAAARNGRVHAVREILRSGRMEPDARDAAGRTTLMQAAAKNQVAVLQTLLEHSRVTTTARDTSGADALTHAVHADAFEAVQALLLNPAIQKSLRSRDPQQRDHHIKTFLAIRSERVLDEFLLGKEIQLHTKDAQNVSVLDRAYQQRDTRFLALLLRSGRIDFDTHWPRVLERALHIEDVAGLGALVKLRRAATLAPVIDTDTARRLYEFSVLNARAHLLSQFEVACELDPISARNLITQALNHGDEYRFGQWLTAFGINPGEHDEHGRSWYHRASAAGFSGAVGFMIPHLGAKTLERTASGNTAMHIAITARRAAVISLLARRVPALTTAAAASGVTPLHLAAAQGQTATIQELLTSGGYGLATAGSESLFSLEARIQPSDDDFYDFLRSEFFTGGES